MISDAVRARVERFWGWELGCTVEVLRGAGVKVRVRRGKGGAFVWRYGESCVWHVPEGWVGRVEGRVGSEGDVERVFTEGYLREVFGEAVKLVLGPCPLAYCGAEMLRREEALPDCRKLEGGDAGEVARLAGECGLEAWEHGGVDLGVQPAVYGCFEGGRLVAAASYEIWGNTIAHVGVATAPAYRGRGFGRSAAWAATAAGLRAGLVPQWRTLASNVASVRVGRAIGFEEVAAHFFVRLGEE